MENPKEKFLIKLFDIVKIFEVETGTEIKNIQFERTAVDVYSCGCKKTVIHEIKLELR